MNIIIKSLIMFSILSSPLDKINFNLLHILSNSKNKNFFLKKQIDNKDIAEMFNEINQNFLKINYLNSQKLYAKNSLNKKLSNLAKNKITLSEAQMADFKDFNKLISEDEKAINFYKIKLKNKKDLILLQNDILSKTTDLNSVFERLSLIVKYQTHIIANLYKNIFNLKCCMEVI